jgi:hypothetical protein
MHMCTCTHTHTHVHTHVHTHTHNSLMHAHAPKAPIPHIAIATKRCSRDGHAYAQCRVPLTFVRDTYTAKSELNARMAQRDVHVHLASAIEIDHELELEERRLSCRRANGNITLQRTRTVARTIRREPLPLARGPESIAHSWHSLAVRVPPVHNSPPPLCHSWPHTMALGPQLYPPLGHAMSPHGK